MLKQRSAGEAEGAGRLPVLTLLRHGLSAANERKCFGGWDDVALSEAGEAQARAAGRALRQAGIAFDIAYTSVLQRAILTTWRCLEEMDLTWLRLVHDWRLNERHYGALQGLSKPECVRLYGIDQVTRWRRSYRVTPPMLVPGEPRDSWGDPRYRGLTRSEVPLGESLHETSLRVQAVWSEHILPSLMTGRNTLVVAHGNSMRALLMTLQDIGEDEISRLEIPNGRPIVFHFDPVSQSVHHQELLL